MTTRPFHLYDSRNPSVSYANYHKVFFIEYPKTNMAKISVFIADDHSLIRQALRVSILTEEDMEVVGEAVDGVEAVNLVPELLPDMVIMDLMMPNMDGFAAIRHLHKRCPRVYILALSSLDKEESIFRAVQAGALGYLTKSAQHEELVDAIRAVSRGEPYLSNKITEKLIFGIQKKTIQEEPEKSVVF